jgi:hypothetical protein
MKKILLAAIAMVMGMHLSMAQNCAQFINAVNGKKMVYSNMDAKGREQGKFNYTSTKKDATTVTIHSEIIDKNGKSLGASDSDVTCSGDAININMQSFIPAASAKQFSNMQVQGDVKYLAYPLNLSAGQTLPDGSANMTINNNGNKMGDVQMDITNRKVVQAETVTTPAGSFDCFKITYDALVRVKMMGIGFPTHMQVAEWFSPKLGRLVKSETYNKNSKLEGTMQLESIN